MRPWIDLSVTSLYLTYRFEKKKFKKILIQYNFFKKYIYFKNGLHSSFFPPKNYSKKIYQFELDIFIIYFLNANVIWRIAARKGNFLNIVPVIVVFIFLTSN